MNFERWVEEIPLFDVILMYAARDDTIQIADIRLIQIMKDGLMKFN